MRLIITRPAEEAAALAARLAARGHACILAPMIEIAAEAEDATALAGVQAFAFTSAQAPPLLGAAFPRTMPVFAVGAATAMAARAAGFALVDSAEGDVGALALMIAARLRPGDGTVLHLSGEPVAGDLTGALSKAGFAARRQIVYRAHPTAVLPEAALSALRTGSAEGAIFLSPRAARNFVTLAVKAEVAGALGRLTAFAMSPAVAEAAEPDRWRQVVTAPRPDLDALLDRIDRHEH